MQRALFAKVRRAPQPTLLSNRRLYVESFNFFSGSRHLIRFHVKVGREKKNQHYSKHTHHLQTAQARVIVEYGVARSTIKQFGLTFIEMNEIFLLKNSLDFG